MSNQKVEIAYNGQYNWMLEDMGDEIAILLFHHETQALMERFVVNLADREDNVFATNHWTKDKQSAYLIFYRGRTVGFTIENFVGFIPEANHAAVEGLDHGEFITANSDSMKKRFAWNFLRTILEASLVNREVKMIRVANMFDTAFALDSNYMISKGVYDKVLTEFKYGAGRDQTNAIWYLAEVGDVLYIVIVSLESEDYNGVTITDNEGLEIKSHLVESTGEVHILFRKPEFEFVFNASYFLGVQGSTGGAVAMNWKSPDDLEDGPVKYVLKSINPTLFIGSTHVVDRVHVFDVGIPVYNGLSGMTFAPKHNTVH